MKNTKLTVKIFLTISLFTSTILADGQMNGGGKTCNPQTQTCLVVENETDETGEDSILTFVQDFLASLLG